MFWYPATASKHLPVLIRAVGDLDLRSLSLGLLLRVRDTNKMAVGHSLETMATGTNLFIHLVAPSNTTS